MDSSSSEDIQKRNPISPSQRDKKNRYISPRLAKMSRKGDELEYGAGGKFHQFNHVSKAMRVPRDTGRLYRRDIYPRDVFHIIMMMMCQWMIGAVNVVVIQYTMLNKDWHCFLCSMGWHFFTVEAIFLMAFTNYWASLSRLFIRRLRLLHMILQLISIGHLVAGVMLIVVKTPWVKYKKHGIIALATCVTFLAAIMTGPFAILSHTYQNIKYFHIFVAAPTFIMTSWTIILGFFTKKFEKDMSKFCVYMTTFFVVVYSCYIIALVGHGASKNIVATKEYEEAIQPRQPHHPVVDWYTWQEQQEAQRKREREGVKA